MSPAIFGSFLICNKFDNAPPTAFGKSLRFSYDHSQLFLQVLWSLLVLPVPCCTSEFILSPWNAQILFQQGQHWHCKNGKSVPLFSQDLSSHLFSRQMFRFILPNQNAQATKRDFQRHQLLLGVKYRLKFPSHCLKRETQITMILTQVLPCCA